MDSVTHLAGPEIDLNGRVIQRCPICGIKLSDDSGRRRLRTKRGLIFRLPVWREGDLIRRKSGKKPVSIGCINDYKELPDDLCLSLVEEKRP